MPSLQPRIDIQQRIDAYSILLTQRAELELLRELVRQAQVALRSVDRRKKEARLA
ncbi:MULTISPECIES: hypothetical protein [unclassified Bradyrhizobium]|uniref:hypothetical protein n=1 Tax=unclassified Bradyrhizobium TaxID=2631580 RepID=UPI002FF0C925